MIRRPCPAACLLGCLSIFSGLILGCSPRAGDEPTAAAPEPKPPLQTASQPAPSSQEVAAATYEILDVGTITLVDGTWEGEPPFPGSASVPTAGLEPGLHLAGDLDGDGAEEAAVFLWVNTGGTGIFEHLAVVGRAPDGAPAQIAAVPLGDRIQLRSAAIADGLIVIETVQAGPEDGACCPGQKFRRSFSLTRGGVEELESEDQGRLSLADLSGVEWVLTHWNAEEAVSGEAEVTLVFEDGRIAGKSACNLYSGTVTAGEIPGDLTLSMPMIGTLMACEPSVDAIEQRYRGALEHLQQFRFAAGQLALTWSHQDEWGTMLFTSRPLPE